jgi:hypothetical protein
MTPEQHQREFEKWRQQREQERALRQEQIDKVKEQMRKNLDRYKYEPMKQILKASDEQWIIIKPKIDEIDKLMSESDVSVKTRTSAGADSAGGSSYGGGSSGGSGGSFGSGSETLNTLDIPPDPNDDGAIDIRYFWSWSKPWSLKADEELTEGEKVCKELFELLENEGSKPGDIDQKAEELLKIRREADEKLTKARQELRGTVTSRQEKLLIMMGWLD